MHVCCCDDSVITSSACGRPIGVHGGLLFSLVTVCFVCMWSPKRCPCMFGSCSGTCQMELPDYQYIDSMLAEWTASDAILQAQCARCVAQSMPNMQSTNTICSGCKLNQPMAAFGHAFIKNWLWGLPVGPFWWHFGRSWAV